MALGEDVGRVQPGPPQQFRVGRLDPRTARLLVSLFACILLLSVLMLLPLPYAMMSPGPVTNTLGEDGGVPLISISGQQTYPTTGTLDLTTVRVFGGGGSRVTPWQMVTGWLSSASAVVPTERLFPPGQSAEQTQEENHLEMVSSQESATAAALRTLGYRVAQHMRVVDFSQDSPSEGVLRKGDLIVSVGGADAGTGDSLRTQLQKVTPGTAAHLVVERDGKDVTLDAGTTRNDEGATVLGVVVEPAFMFPFTVTIQIENVGGPSAGTMFALGIIDKLTATDLTGGRSVAGTGTIDPEGTVGPIGGIRQKMIGARQAGTALFLAPADNCDEVVGHIPDGLSVVRITTLAQARSVLEKVASGTPLDDPSLPRCG